MQTSLYKISKNLEVLKEIPFKKERELQNIFEANLSHPNYGIYARKIGIHNQEQAN